MKFIIWECRKCKHRAGVLPNIRIVCSKCNTSHEPDEITDHREPPSFSIRSRNYQKELSKWLAAGRPVRTEEETTRIRTICSSCDKLEDGVCLLCGCPMIRPYLWGDKILWATSSCPDDPPKW